MLRQSLFMTSSNKRKASTRRNQRNEERNYKRKTFRLDTERERSNQPTNQPERERKKKSEFAYHPTRMVRDKQAGRQKNEGPVVATTTSDTSRSTRKGSVVQRCRCLVSILLPLQLFVCLFVCLFSFGWNKPESNNILVSIRFVSGPRCARPHITYITYHTELTLDRRVIIIIVVVVIIVVVMVRVNRPRCLVRREASGPTPVQRTRHTRRRTLGEPTPPRPVVPARFVGRRRGRCRGRCRRRWYKSVGVVCMIPTTLATTTPLSSSIVIFFFFFEPREKEKERAVVCVLVRVERRGETCPRLAKAAATATAAAVVITIINNNNNSSSNNNSAMHCTKRFIVI